MSIYVFIGPTLPVAQAREHLEAEYLPPVAQGDVLRLLARAPTAIGIVDGLFEMVPSVWHEEILLALERGVPVFGAASMGALRAAELSAFGMVGIGEIHQRYQRGELEDDDEVAVAHGPAEYGYRELSEAMVNIRDVCRAAVGQGVVEAESAARIERLAKGLHYPERTYRRVLELALEQGVDPAAAAALGAFARGHRPTLKQRDAIALLRHLAAWRADGAPAPGPGTRVERTVFLEALRAEVEQAPTG